MKGCIVTQPVNFCLKIRKLWRKAFAYPVAVNQAVLDAVVQAAGAALPEFDAVGNNEVSAPMRRAGNMQGMFDTDGRGLGHQYGFAGNHFTLRACPCADTAGIRAAFKIFVRSGCVEFFNASFNAHLAFEFRPEQVMAAKGCAV